MTKICGVEISSPDKIIFPKQNITKLDIVNYYKTVYVKMKPFLTERPVSAIRCHGKYNGEKFFKKHPIDTENVEKIYFGAKKPQNLYFYLNSKTQLINQVQLDTFEFHLWGANVKNISHPDIMVFDLDPDEKLSLKTLRQGVKHLKNILDELNLKSFLKTSGGKGYHIYVPFKNVKSFNALSKFSKQIATLMEQKYPNLYTTNMLKSTRKNKIFIDYLRNKQGATCVAPYSLRMRDEATVSMPISWSELDSVKPNQFNINSAIKRLNNNPWKNFFKVNQSLN